MHLLIAAATFGALVYAGVGLAVQPRESVGAGFVTASGGLVAPDLLPARARRADGGVARRLHRQHLAADGRRLDSRKGVFGLTPWARSIVDDMTTVAIRPPRRRLRRRRGGHRAGDRWRIVARAAGSLARRSAALALLALLQVGLGDRDARAGGADRDGARPSGGRAGAVRHGGGELARDGHGAGPSGGVRASRRPGGRHSLRAPGAVSAPSRAALFWSPLRACALSFVPANCRRSSSRCSSAASPACA